MKLIKYLAFGCILATLAVWGGVAQSAQAVKHCECKQKPKSLSQLPLEPVRVRLQFPARLDGEVGKWRAIDEIGNLVKEKGCRESGPCASYDKQVSTKTCSVGYINLALHLWLVKPGTYTIEWIPDSGNGKIGPIVLKLKEPVGADKEIYEKLLLSAWDSKFAKMDWDGVLSGCYQKEPQSIYSIILEKYPTSTYAGYALARSVPTNTSPVTGALSSLSDPEDTLRKWADQGGGEQQILQTTKKAEENMKRYVKSAGPFLEAHPDFFYAPLIRRYYAMCLGFTGDIPGAMKQISILAKGQGKEADEAKAFLAEKESKKGKN